MDFRFIGASMGSAVGEKIARAFEMAASLRHPLVLVTASGGARMQEGMFSLMQMAKTSAAAARLAEMRVPYIAVLTNPTMGGVTASFATLADVIIAEPGALIGFAGPRLVEQTIRKSLPKGFQTAEALLDHGMVDMVVDRRELAETLAALLGYLQPGDE
jgi:acetyl-CoA carboxylase carboxyl transferase subunit beta